MFGITREKSYKIVQTYAKRCFSENKSLYELISKDRKIMSIMSEKKLRSIFDYSSHLKKVNIIFKRVFK